MATVIDASVMVAQLLPDEAHSDIARSLLEQLDTEERIAPITFWYEIRDEISPVADSRNDEARTLNLAQRHNLTVYDAIYLETSIRHKARLATFDRNLATAVSKETIENPAVQLGAINAELLPDIARASPSGLALSSTT